MSSVGLRLRVIPYQVLKVWDAFFTFLTFPWKFTFKTRVVRSIMTLVVPTTLPPLIDTRRKELLARNKSSPRTVPPPIPKDLESKVAMSVYSPDPLWQGWFIYPKEAPSTPSTLTLYLPGGAYLNSPQPAHFLNLYDLCDRIKSPILILQYPLPPLNRETNVLATLTSLVNELRSQDVEGSSFPQSVKASLKTCDRWAICGDSAGGGFAYALGLHLADLADKEKTNASIQPNEIVGMAPWLDLNCSHPEIPKVNDPWLNPTFLRIAALEWVGLSSDTPTFPKSLPPRLSDPFASPYQASSALLQSLHSKTRLSIMVGTDDTLYPECRDFSNRLEEELNGKEGKAERDDELGSFEAKSGRVAFRAWERQIHVFSILPISFKERDEAREWIASRLVGK